MQKRGWKTVVCGVVSLLVALLITTVITKPAFAGTGDDYPAKWKDVPRDSVFDDWKEYNRECTSFAAFRLSSRNGYTMPFNDMAINWIADATARHIPVDRSPAVGAIAWFSFGHVAWVESVGADSTTVHIEEYNNPAGSGAYNQRNIAVSQVTNFIHFDDISNSSGSGTTASSPAPNLFEIQHWLTNSGMTEVRGLNASSNYTSWIGGWTTPDGWHGGDAVDYGMTDANGDGVQDVYKIQYGYTNSGMTEVQVLNGASNFTQWVGGWVTADPYHAPGTVHYTIGNFDGDNRPDVFVIPTNQTPGGHVEVKVLTGASNYSQWAGGWVTPEGWHDASGVDYVLSSCGTNGRPNLYEILHTATNSGMTEVREFNVATSYQTFVGGWVTPDGVHDGNSVNYTAGGCNANGKPNIYEIIHQATNSGMTEVRELNGAINYATWVGGWPTPDGLHSGYGIDYVMPLS